MDNILATKVDDLDKLQKSEAILIAVLRRTKAWHYHDEKNRFYKLGTILTAQYQLVGWKDLAGKLCVWLGGDYVYFEIKDIVVYKFDYFGMFPTE